MYSTFALDKNMLQCTIYANKLCFVMQHPALDIQSTAAAPSLFRAYFLCTADVNSSFSSKDTFAWVDCKYIKPNSVQLLVLVSISLTCIIPLIINTKRKLVEVRRFELMQLVQKRKINREHSKHSSKTIMQVLQKVKPITHFCLPLQGFNYTCNSLCIAPI